jgi:hypothetical protein
MKEVIVVISFAETLKKHLRFWITNLKCAKSADVLFRIN